MTLSESFKQIGLRELVERIQEVKPKVLLQRYKAYIHLQGCFEAPPEL
jgi:hypothetical protein